jgi:hypothetical protein
MTELHLIIQNVDLEEISKCLEVRISYVKNLLDTFFARFVFSASIFSTPVSTYVTIDFVNGVCTPLIFTDLIQRYVIENKKW